MELDDIADFGRSLAGKDTGVILLKPGQRFIDRCSIDNPNTSQRSVCSVQKLVSEGAS